MAMDSQLESDTAARLLSSVARVHRWASRHADLPLPAAQARLLALIEQLGTGRIGELAEHDHCSQPTMTTQVQRLERAGLVSRAGDPDDRRATVIQLTQHGKDVLHAARQERIRCLQPVLSELSPQERADLDRAIEVLDAMLRRAEEVGP